MKHLQLMEILQKDIMFVQEIQKHLALLEGIYLCVKAKKSFPVIMFWME